MNPDDQGEPALTPQLWGERDVRSLFGQPTAVFALLTGPTHHLETANAAFFELFAFGGPTRTGLPLQRLVPDVAELGMVSILDEVYRTGAPHTARDTRVRPRNGERREALFDFIYEPRLGPDGTVIGVTVLGVETTQATYSQRLAVEHRALLEQIARQVPLNQVLEGMARVIEELSPGVLASVLLADEGECHLRHGAAPSLPAFFSQAADGIPVGEGNGSCGTAAHRREAVIVTDIATDPLWAGPRDLALKASLAACWSTPIVSRDGRLLGTFGMYHRAPRAPQEADLLLCRIFADIAVLAIERHHTERARAAAEERERAARADLAYLLEAGTALSHTTLDHTQTLQRLASLCVPTLAPLCAVDVLDSGRVRRVATAAPSSAERSLLATRVPLYDADDDAVARVLTSGITEVTRRAPTGPGPWADLGVTGYLCIPLVDRGKPFGALTLLATAEHTLDDRTVALAEELARRASAAARNARQYSQRVQLSRDLQAGLLLPDLPTLPGAELATYYSPAGEGLEVGGDFYDVFPLDDNRWAFMIGDVCGRGAIAATTTGLVRHTARAVARLLPDPASVVNAVNAALLEHPHDHGTGFVTLVYGHLHRNDDQLAIDLVRAGHVNPRVLSPDGSVQRIDPEGIILGVHPGPSFDTLRLDLRAGQSLVLVTDGITEARSPDGSLFDDDGLDRALTAALTASPGAARPKARAKAAKTARARAPKAARTPAPKARTVLDAVTTAVRDFTQDTVIDDDQAALVLTATHPVQAP